MSGNFVVYEIEKVNKSKASSVCDKKRKNWCELILISKPIPSRLIHSFKSNEAWLIHH